MSLPRNPSGEGHSLRGHRHAAAKEGSHMPAQTPSPRGPAWTPTGGDRLQWPEEQISHLEYQIKCKTIMTCEVQVNNTLLFGTSRSHVSLGASSLSKLPTFT